MAATRRERHRAATTTEIVQRAVAQVAGGGAQALSLNAIAREMGTSGPAIYRYFASRDALLAAVAAAGYDDLTDALTGADRAARRRRPAGRWRAVAGAYRGWALAHAELYRLMFSGPAGSGRTAPELVVPAAHRAMLALAGAVPADAPTPPDRSRLPAQIAGWARSREGGDPPADPATLRRALRAWTRMHGVVSLELEGAWASMGLDPALLFEAEVISMLG